DDGLLRVVVEEAVVALGLEEADLARDLAALVTAQAVDDVTFVGQARLLAELEFAEQAGARVLVRSGDDVGRDERPRRDVLEVRVVEEVEAPERRREDPSA